MNKPPVKLKFPDIYTSSQGYAIPDLTSSSLLNDDQCSNRPIPVKRENTHFLWRFWQNPLNKWGLVILILAFVLTLTPVPAPLLWIGRGGAVAGICLIGLSIFQARSQAVPTLANNVKDEPLNDDYSYS